MITFGQRFKQLRLKKKMTQEELVNDFNQKYHYNLGKSAISQYENNKRFPEINVLICFASYFNISINYLLCIPLPKEDRVKETEGIYLVNSEYQSVELTDLIEEFNDVLTSDKDIYLSGELVSESAIQTLKTCLKVGLELVKEASRD